VGKRLGSDLELTLSGANLFDAASGRFTVFGGGVPYREITAEDAAGGSGPVLGEQSSED
jgi:hypothetical protein